MTLFMEAAIAAVICAAAAALIFAVRPLRPGTRGFSEDTRVTAVISAQGDPHGLEQAVRELLHCSGIIGSTYRSVVIADCGLSDEGRKIAELLASGDGRIALCVPEKLPALLLEDSGWTARDSTYK